MDNLHIEETNEYGTDRGRGNLLGIEPYMLATDYASKKSFQSKLDGYLAFARRKKWLNARTIVLWPEYIGTFLLAAGEGADVYHASTLAEASAIIAKNHADVFNAYLAAATEQDKPKAALIRTTAQTITEIYQTSFSELSRKYKVTTVAGSVALPEPQILNGKVVSTAGAIYNCTAVFGPNGKTHPHILCKAFPTAHELPFTTPAPVGSIPTYETPAGRVGVLICADSWFPTAYDQLLDDKVDYVVVPSYGTGGLESWTETWEGYDGWPAPTDVNPNDVGKITQGQAWLKYALAGRIGECKAKRGINVFLRGQIWDQMVGGGRATIASKGKIKIEEPSAGASFYNLWL